MKCEAFFVEYMKTENSAISKTNKFPSDLKSFLFSVFFLFFPSGVPTVVKTNILIRSMGPVSELNMVSIEVDCKLCKIAQHKIF